MSDTINIAELGGQIPPHKVYRVVLARAIRKYQSLDIDTAAVEQTVMAHVMSVGESGVLMFYHWRLETIADMPCAVLYPTDAFAEWDEAHEMPMPAAGKAGKTH